MSGYKLGISRSTIPVVWIVVVLQSLLIKYSWALPSSSLTDASFCFRDEPAVYLDDLQDIHDNQASSTSDISSSSCPEPYVPKALWFGKPCRNPQRCTSVAACMVVSYSLLSYFDADVAFLNGGLCRRPLPAGNATHRDVNHMFAPAARQEHVIGMYLNGSDLWTALEEGIMDLPSQSPPPNGEVVAMRERLPMVAGVEFRVHRDQPSGQRISGLQILTRDCAWEPVQPDRMYSVVTTETLVQGGLGYPTLPNAGFGFWNASKTVQQVFWEQSQATCLIQEPFPPQFPRYQRTEPVRRFANSPPPQQQQPTASFNLTRTTRSSSSSFVQVQ